MNSTPNGMNSNAKTCKTAKVPVQCALHVCAYLFLQVTHLRSNRILVGYFMYEIHVFERMYVIRATIVVFVSSGIFLLLSSGVKGIYIYMYALYYS